METLEKITDDYLKFRIKDFIPLYGYFKYCDRVAEIKLTSPEFDAKEGIEGCVRDLALLGYHYMTAITGALVIIELASKLMGLQGKP
jgi:hypothetical protein